MEPVMKTEMSPIHHLYHPCHCKFKIAISVNNAAHCAWRNSRSFGETEEYQHIAVRGLKVQYNTCIHEMLTVVFCNAIEYFPEVKILRRCYRTTDAIVLQNLLARTVELV